MDYKLERKIKLIEKSSKQGLYEWCLNEIDDDGKSDGDEVIWPWSFYFTASSLQLNRHFEIKRRDHDAKEKTEKITNLTSISADLYSGTCSDGENLEHKVRFSMFGTTRNIENFSLAIHPVDSIGEESCSLWGSPSYDYEVDFRHGTTEDTVVINLNIYKEKFEEFVKAIESKSIDFASVRIGGVSGFYSHWSPSITTSYIKVLTEYHQVEGSDTSSVNIFRTGDVGDFSISLHTINELNIRPNLKSIDFYKRFRALDSDDDHVHHSNLKVQSDMVSQHSLDGKEQSFHAKLVNSLKLPLWLIFILLLFALIK